MEREIFADGIGEITLSGGMVRMDLVTMVGTQKGKDQPPQLEFRQRVVMPPDGFLRSFSAMENLVKQLIDAGLVKPRDGEQAGNAENSVSTTAPANATPPKSPNFWPKLAVLRFSYIMEAIEKEDSPEASGTNAQFALLE